MISNRTRISLAQHLLRQSPHFIHLLLEKHGLAQALTAWDEWGEWAQRLVSFLRQVQPDPLYGVLVEVVATEDDLRDRVVDQWGNGADAYDARWRDLVQCLLLDGYAVDKHRLVAVDPVVTGANQAEDVLADEIFKSGLPNAASIVSLLDQSADAFRQTPPNHNACLSNARAALQTLATEIAVARQQVKGGSFQPDKWGQVLAYLRTSALITRNDEDLVASVYTFISPGAHQPIGLSQEELVRLGRGMAVSASYFLVKLHNG